MKTLIILLVLVLFSNFSYSQNKEEILNELKNMLEDSVQDFEDRYFDEYDSLLSKLVKTKYSNNDVHILHNGDMVQFYRFLNPDAIESDTDNRNTFLRKKVRNKYFTNNITYWNFSWEYDVVLAIDDYKNHLKEKTYINNNLNFLPYKPNNKKIEPSEIVYVEFYREVEQAYIRCSNKHLGYTLIDDEYKYSEYQYDFYNEILEKESHEGLPSKDNMECDVTINTKTYIISYFQHDNFPSN